MRKLFGTQRAAEDERQRDETQAGHVRAMIEPRHPGARRHRDPELLPQPIAAELQLIDRSGKHVLHDHQSCVRGDNQALGRDQAVSYLARVLVQQRDGGYELTIRHNAALTSSCSCRSCATRRMSDSRVPST